jgi:hypothetical protein
MILVAYSQVLQHLLQKSNSKVPALFAVQITRDPEAEEEIGH